MSDVALWRYMDFWKFSDIIDNNRLFFAFRNSFADAHEGKETNQTITQITDYFITNMLSLYPGEGTLIGNEQDFVNTRRKQIQLWLDQMGINCWHINPSINRAMISKFADDPIDAVIIKSSKERICSVLKEQFIEFECDEVKYIDFKKDTFDPRGHYNFLFHMPNYPHLVKENEFRFIIPVYRSREDCMHEYYHADSIPSKEYIARKSLRDNAIKNGFFVKIDTDKLIEAIYCNSTVVDEIKKTTNIPIHSL